MSSALKALSLDPSDYDVHWRLAVAYLHTRQFDKAEGEYPSPHLLAMPYHPLAVPPGTNPNLERMVREQIDPLLRDVHAMLRLPMDGAPGLEGGCTFPAALTLLEVVGGALLRIRKGGAYFSG